MTDRIALTDQQRDRLVILRDAADRAKRDLELYVGGITDGHGPEHAVWRLDGSDLVLWKEHK